MLLLTLTVTVDNSLLISVSCILRCICNEGSLCHDTPYFLWLLRSTIYSSQHIALIKLSCFDNICNWSDQVKKSRANSLSNHRPAAELTLKKYNWSLERHILIFQNGSMRYSTIWRAKYVTTVVIQVFRTIEKAQVPSNRFGIFT